LHTWCTGCGNYNIWGAVRNTLVEEQIWPHQVTLVYDIGCNGNGADKIGGYGFKGIHGRAIPLAAGIALANTKQTVIASSGDGALLAEGIGHFIHAIRSNYNFTYMIHNNSNFALTTGQASPASPKGRIMNASPHGVSNPPINISQLVLSLEPTFFARAYSGHPKQLAHVLSEGIKHKGFAVIEIMQECPTYNPTMNSEWYNERIYDIETVKDYDVTNHAQAVEISKDMTTHIVTGVIFKDTTRKSFLEEDVIRKDIATELIDEVAPFDISALLNEFRR
jgi:2-oxoglutarate ferredoxin oxidoreductase subunit beta